MANSFVDNVGDGATLLWSVTFPFISRDDVTVINTDTEASISFTWISDSQISISPAVANATNFRIKRTTQVSARLVDFQDATNLNEATLDLDSNQLFYVLQERIDGAGLDVVMPTSGINTTMPTPVALEVLRWNAAANGVESVPLSTIDAAVISSYMDTLLDDTSAAEARATLGLVIGTDVQAYDSTILVDADIGVNVQAYDATIVVDADIGTTVQAYDVDTLKADTTDNLTAGFTTDDETMTYAATISPDFTAEGIKKLIATGNITAFNKPASGGSGTCAIRLEIDNVSGISVTAGTGVTFFGDSLAAAADNEIFYLTCNYYSSDAEMEVIVRKKI